MLLKSKTVVVTGGSMGLGFAVARKCAREGANVVIAARNKKDLDRALAELKKQSMGRCAAFVLDVGALNRVVDFASWCKNKFRTIHGLVNCAGIYGPIGRLNVVDLKLFEDTVQINFLGTVRMCHAFYPLFDPDARKKIVNFSGGGAAAPFPNYSAYAAGKAAVVRFTENLAVEWAGDQFDINCVAPGFVVTRLHEQTMEKGAALAGESFFENTKKQIQNGGVSPELAANLVSFLLSDQSDGITGKFISAPWDPWQDAGFQERLRTDKDLATLRRIDGRTFVKSEA